jgi:hypothetical protein
MIIVEDGTQVANANSYNTVNELVAFAIARNVTLLTDPEVLITKSMDFMESKNYLGRIVASTQALQWPRSGVTIDGYGVLSTTIPQLLKDAQLAVCMEIEAGNNPLSTLKQEKQSVTIGPISTTYKTGSSSSPTSRAVNVYFKKLVANNGAYSLNR